MFLVNIKVYNQVFITIDTDIGICQEIHEHFSFRPPNYRYMHKFKTGQWDGWIRLFNIKTRRIYRGLLPRLLEFLKNKGYRVKIDEELLKTNSIDDQEIFNFILSLNLPFKPRDYQVEYFSHVIRNKRAVILSSTGSGKSLIIYMLIRFFQEFLNKGLIVVPTISLVSQMYKNFEEYGYNVEKNVHQVTAGISKYTKKFLTISTYQSIYNLNEEYFKNFDFLIIDECHLAEAKSLAGIAEKCINSSYRVGTTGTLKDSKTNIMTLEGLFGKTKKVISTKELMDRGELSQLEVKFLIFEYPEIERKMVKNLDYSDELKVIISNNMRNEYIKNLSLSLKGNTLILYQFVGDHGRILYDMIRGNGKEVFFIHGNVSADAREAVREIADSTSGCIIIASYGTFSTGINIKNLDNLIFASPLKSKIKVLQSIGRVLRVFGEGKIATIYDLVDDLCLNKNINFLFRHYLERRKLYKKENFSCKSFRIPLNIN